MRVVRRTGPGTPDADADLPAGKDAPPQVAALARAGLDRLPVHLHGPRRR